MILLLDQGLPRSTVQHLIQFGVNAEHVAQFGLSKATDDEIFKAAA